MPVKYKTPFRIWFFFSRPVHIIILFSVMLEWLAFWLGYCKWVTDDANWIQRLYPRLFYRTYQARINQIFLSVLVSVLYEKMLFLVFKNVLNFSFCRNNDLQNIFTGKSPRPVSADLPTAANVRGNDRGNGHRIDVSILKVLCKEK